MEPAKGLADHVERWLSWVPGIGTYLEREQRRETDKKIRERISAQLQDIRGHLKRLTLDFSRGQHYDSLVDLDRLSAHIQQMANTIRYASYGYAGIFDLEKIREEEIYKLCSFDLSLKEDVEKLEAKVGEMISSLPLEKTREKIREADGLVVNLEKKFQKRRDFMGRRA